MRAVQYLGNKSRIVGEIADRVSAVRDPKRPLVCDFFSGTGVVSGALGQNFATIGIDVQEYARVLTSAQLAPRVSDTDAIVAELRRGMQDWLDSPVGELVRAEQRVLDGAESRPERIVELVEAGSLEAGSRWEFAHPMGDIASDALEWARSNGHSTAFRYYGGVFFSYRQALEIDLLTRLAHQTERPARDTALAAVLGAASSVVNSVGGHFAQPVSLKDRSGRVKVRSVASVRNRRQLHAAAQFVQWVDKYAALKPAVPGSYAVRSDVEDFARELPESVGCVYADPPYTREHYSRFYHVLETLARGVDEPGITPTTRGDGRGPSKGLYASERYQSPYSVVREAPAALESLARTLSYRGVPLVLSYSPIPDTDKPRQRVMQLADISDTLRTHFGNVSVHPIDGIRHARLNSRAHSATAITGSEEVLIVATQSPAG